ncbi:cation-binding protein [Sphingobacteriaceae bacterium]|nr:cation-binding protein [Sphingobacteriaceae bacterium]
MESLPIKRSKALQPLSREHHYELLFCWKIRTGFKKNIDVSRIKKYADWFFKNRLIPHFSEEEAFVFPLLGKDHELVKKALADHRRLTRLFEDSLDIKKSLSLLEEELEKHIRFEERILFTEIQKAASEQNLDLIMKVLSEVGTEEEWDDEFWK